VVFCDGLLIDFGEVIGDKDEIADDNMIVRINVCVV